MANVILPIVPNAARFAVTGTNQGQAFTNVFHGHYSNVPADGPTMNSICQAVHTAYINSISAIVGSEVIVAQVTGVDLSSRTGAVGVYALSHPGTDAASSAWPPSAAVCVSWIIQDRYRGGHPRSYFPGPHTADFTNNRLLTTTGHTKWLNAASGFLTNFNAMTAGASSWKLCTVRYFSQGQVLPNPYVRDIQTAAVHGRLDSQRRRLGKEVP